MEITSEQLDEIERLIVSGNPSDALALAPEPVLKIIALARQGLQLKNWQTTAGKIHDELVTHKIKVSTLNAELEALRKDKERLDKAEALADTNLSFPQKQLRITWNPETNSLRTALDSAMEGAQ